ncbi:hypothetical protein M0805_007004 [Coniferiporia weirii]|nr:hypothetical protein M0805_007004 [Coniferiporia weirii]
MAADAEDHAMGRVAPYAFPSGRVSPLSGNVLTRAHILDAIARSADDGCTLNLSNKNLVDVGGAGVDALAEVGRGGDPLDECRILRIALIGNCLSSLPMSFARLSRLRYLTLRSNSFSVFPEVLTTMSSLEILDFSRNKVRGLPTNPGTLVNLRVMSISRNKIRKLPSYISKFRNLTVLKADHNPIEWPPKHIMEPEEDLEESDVMPRWVESLKVWMAENSAEDEKGLPRPVENLLHENQDEIADLQHSRSVSVDSESSIYSTSSYVNSIEDVKAKQPPAIDTENIQPAIANDLSASPESYLPTPDDSLASAAGDDTAQSLYSVHGRNKSYTPAGEGRNGSRALSVQKSLPDLRVANGRVSAASHVLVRAPMGEATKKLSKESSRSFTELPDPTLDGPLRGRSQRPPRHNHGTMPSIIERKIPSMDYERNSYFRRLSTLPVSTISRTTPPALLSIVDSVRGILFAVSQVYQSLQHYTVYAIDERLSSVLLKVLDPASSYMMQLITALDKFDSLSKRGCPPPSVCRLVIERCRDNVAMFGKAVGVLAMQLKVLASRDDVRYSRQMLLVVYGAMAEISNSWHGIAPHLDSIEPLLREGDHSPLSSPGLTTPTPMRTVPLKSHFASQTSNRILIPPITEQPEPTSATATPAFPRTNLAPAPTITRARSAQPQASAPHVPVAPAMARPTHSEGRSRMNRRHAGSFSVKDVEIGRALPSNAEASPPAGGVASGSSTPTPRPHIVPLRGIIPISTLAHTTPVAPPSGPLPQYYSPVLHSRQGSAQNGRNGTPPLNIPGPSRNVLDVPSNSNTLVDKEAIDAVASAVRAAPAVWLMLEEIANEMVGSPVDLRDSLVRAQDVTRRLGANIKAIQESQPGADRKALREDAHVFIKTVISLSKVAKDYGAAHRLSTQLRSDIAKLTNATQEFVMLLHVSSYAPATPRPYSPMITGNGIHGTASGLGVATNSHSPILGGAAPSEDRSQSGNAGLSRSRSAQPAASSRLVPAGTPSPTPRSALPHQQTFRIPTAPTGATRPGGGSRLRVGDFAGSAGTTSTTEGGLLAEGQHHAHVYVNGL